MCIRDSPTTLIIILTSYTNNPAINDVIDNKITRKQYLPNNCQKTVFSLLINLKVITTKKLVINP